VAAARLALFHATHVTLNTTLKLLGINHQFDPFVFVLCHCHSFLLTGRYPMSYPSVGTNPQEAI
jgi:hypothetical protein